MRTNVFGSRCWLLCEPSLPAATVPPRPHHSESVSHSTLSFSPSPSRDRCSRAAGGALRPRRAQGELLRWLCPTAAGRVDADQAARAAAGLLCRRRGEAPQYAASAGDLGRAGKACGLGRRAVSSIFWGAAPFILWGAGESLAGGGRPCAARPPSRLCRPSGS